MLDKQLVMREKPGINKDGLILYNNIEEWVEDGSPVFILDKFIDSFMNQETIKLNGETVEYDKGKSSKGELPYGAACLLKLYIYGYYNRISSSYRLETESRRNLELIYLLRGLRPSRRTISDFRQHNGDLIKAAFLYLNEQLRDNGIMLTKSVSIDGTKIKANANSTAEKFIERWRDSLQKKMEKYMESVSKEDSDSDLLTEKLEAQSKLHKEVIASMQETIDSLTKDLEELKKKGTVSPVIAAKLGKRDKDCKAMMHKDNSVQPSYNVQVSTDNASHCIVTSNVTTDANDINQLSNVVDQITEEAGEMPEEVDADNGYCNFEQMHALEEKSLKETGKKIKLYIPVCKSASEKNDEMYGLTFTYDKDKDVCTCPNGVTMNFKKRGEKRGRKYRVFQADLSDCKACPLYGKCTKATAGGRSIWIGDRLEYRREQAAKMETDEAQKRINGRKGKIENVFGTLKTWMGKIPFLLRGKEKVSIEMDLYCIAYNLRRTVSICAKNNVSLAFS